MVLLARIGHVQTISAVLRNVARGTHDRSLVKARAQGLPTPTREWPRCVCARRRLIVYLPRSAVPGGDTKFSARGIFSSLVACR
eukprot:7235725-Prymnesium_polylepis.1